MVPQGIALGIPYWIPPGIPLRILLRTQDWDCSQHSLIRFFSWIPTGIAFCLNISSVSSRHSSWILSGIALGISYWIPPRIPTSKCPEIIAGTPLAFFPGFLLWFFKGNFKGFILNLSKDIWIFPEFFQALLSVFLDWFFPRFFLEFIQGFLQDYFWDSCPVFCRNFFGKYFLDSFWESSPGFYPRFLLGFLKRFLQELLLIFVQGFLLNSIRD